MKVNEAPDKIYVYIPDDDIVGTASVKKGVPHQFVTEEYTRIDAFIEKAEDFISRKICDYIVHYNYGPNNDMETMYVDSRFFEDFKNYMKGE